MRDEAGLREYLLAGAWEAREPASTTTRAPEDVMLIACPECHRQYDVGDIAPGRKVRCLCGALTEVPTPRSAPTRMAHCFSCGGPLRDGATDCVYCGGTVSLLMRGAGDACPECFARLARDARFCGGCGVRIAPTSALKALTSTRCPRCKGELARCEGEGQHFTECLACGGLWLDEARFEALIAKRREEGASGRPEFSRAAPAKAASPEAEVRYLPCPSCGELMQRRNFGRGSGVILDWCRGHGVWFDAQELEQALAWASSDPGRASWSAPEAPRRSGRSRVDLPLEPRSKPSAVIQVIDFVVDLFVTPW